MYAWIDPFTNRAVESWPKGDGGVQKLTREASRQGYSTTHGSPLSHEDLRQFIAAGYRIRNGRHETQIVPNGGQHVRRG